MSTKANASPHDNAHATVRDALRAQHQFDNVRLLQTGPDRIESLSSEGSENSGQSQNNPHNEEALKTTSPAHTYKPVTDVGRLVLEAGTSLQGHADLVGLAQRVDEAALAYGSECAATAIASLVPAKSFDAASFRGSDVAERGRPGCDVEDLVRRANRPLAGLSQQEKADRRAARRALQMREQRRKDKGASPLDRSK